MRTPGGKRVNGAAEGKPSHLRPPTVVPYLRFRVFQLDADDVVAVPPEHRDEGVRGGGVHDGGAEGETSPEGGIGVNGGAEVPAGSGDVSESSVGQQTEYLDQRTVVGQLQEGRGIGLGIVRHGSETVFAQPRRFDCRASTGTGWLAKILGLRNRARVPSGESEILVEVPRSFGETTVPVKSVRGRRPEGAAGFGRESRRRRTSLLPFAKSLDGMSSFRGGSRGSQNLGGPKTCRMIYVFGVRSTEIVPNAKYQTPNTFILFFPTATMLHNETTRIYCKRLCDN